MAGSDPFDRNWLEVRILNHLNESHQPVSLRVMRDNLIADHQESIVCSTFELRDDGLVVIREIIGDHLVSITPQGLVVLSSILSGKTSC